MAPDYSENTNIRAADITAFQDIRGAFVNESTGQLHFGAIPGRPAYTNHTTDYTKASLNRNKGPAVEQDVEDASLFDNVDAITHESDPDNDLETCQIIATGTQKDILRACDHLAGDAPDTLDLDIEDNQIRLTPNTYERRKKHRLIILPVDKDLRLPTDIVAFINHNKTCEPGDRLSWKTHFPARMGKSSSGRLFLAIFLNTMMTNIRIWRLGGNIHTSYLVPIKGGIPFPGHMNPLLCIMDGAMTVDCIDLDRQNYNNTTGEGLEFAEFAMSGLDDKVKALVKDFMELTAGFTDGHLAEDPAEYAAKMAHRTSFLSAVASGSSTTPAVSESGSSVARSSRRASSAAPERKPKRRASEESANEEDEHASKRGRQLRSP